MPVNKTDDGILLNGTKPENSTPPPLDDVEALKQSLSVLEGLFHAVNAASFLPRWFSAVNNGMAYVAQLHQTMFEKLPPEEQAKAKKVTMGEENK